MKKYLSTALIFSLVIAFACKKEEPKPEQSAQSNAPAIVSKCAKYAISVYKDKERTVGLTTLSKAEIVDQISTEIISNKGAVAEIAYIKLSDGKEGYLETKYLADKAIVFTQDTKAHQRNNSGSKVNAIIPAGTLAFVIDEKADWLQVYIGQIDGQWLTQEWVNGGFSTEAGLIADAKLYEEALAVFRNKDAKESDREGAKKKLKDLQASTLFSEKAETLLQSFAGQPNAE